MYELLSRTPQGAGTPDPQKSVFPQEHRAACPGMSSPQVPIRTFQNEGWCPWDTKCCTVSSRSLLNPKCWKWTWQRFFQWNVSLEMKPAGTEEGQAAVMGQGECGEGRDSPIAMLCPALTHPGFPQVTCRQIPWFYLPLLLYFLPIPPFQSSCLLVLLQCIFIHSSSPTGLSVLTKLAISF